MDENAINNSPKIGIIGLGPVGQILAVHFKEFGCEVSITDLDQLKLSLIRKSGIEIIGKVEKSAQFEHIYSSIEELLTHKYDLIVCAAKAYHVDAILDSFNSENINSYILGAQNGLGIKRKYINHFDESKVFRMVVNFAGYMQAPNVTEATFFNPPNFIAPINDAHPEVSEWIAKGLTSVGLLTENVLSFDVASKAWEKTILNAALSPLCAISRLTMKEAMDNPDTLEIVEYLLYEAQEVARAEEIKLPENFVKLCIRYLKNTGNHMPSLAIDLMNNRQTEIDYLNGKIVEYGKKHYIKTPLNLTLTNLVRAVSKKNDDNQKKK